MSEVSSLIDFLLTRRSAKPALLGEPGPSPEELNKILTAAARVPDHKKLAPWRFIVFEGEARAKFGEVLAEVCAAEETPEPSPVRLETERARLTRAPVVVAVISHAAERPGVPEWEQILSTGAANALGYGTSWITEWYSYSPGVRKALGLADNERVAGFIYIGTEREKQPDRERPALSEIVSRWQG